VPDTAARGDEATKECAPVLIDGGGGVPEPEPGERMCAAGVCNYQTQEGCAEAEACRPRFGAGSTSVVPGCEPAGDGRSGASCASSAECARGYFCVPSEGVCRKLCCGRDWSACDAGESCIRQFSVAFGDRVEYAVDLCYPIDTCDVFAADSCKEESVDAPRECKIVDPTGAVACTPRSSRRLGDACSPPDVCAQGLSCVAGRCRRLCRAELCGEPSCPPEEGACVHFDRDPAGVGECTPGWEERAREASNP
jgi:hypothetical protein